MKSIFLSVLIVSLLATMLATLVVIWFTMSLIKTDSRQTLCLDQVEARYDYISRKMCDPTKPEPCYIEPSLQLELEVWKLEEMNKCK